MSSPDTDQSPESPVPDPSPTSPTSPKSPKSPKSPRIKVVKTKTKLSKPTPSKDPRKTLKAKKSTPTKIKVSKLKTKSKSKSHSQKQTTSKTNKASSTKTKGSKDATKDGKAGKDGKDGKDKENSTKSKSKISKAKTKEQCEQLLLFLADPKHDITERYNASKRIHSYILSLVNKEERMKYATKFLANHEIKDEKIRGVFIDFMCKFATAPKYDGLDSFTVILRPFTQLLVYAIQEKGKKTSTIKRIVYGFAQIYPVMLARLCRVWKGNEMNKGRDDINSDDEDGDNDYSKTFPNYAKYKAVFDVSQKIVDNILLLLPSKKPEVRDFAIKFAKSMILHATCQIITKDKNRFSLTNIKPGHPLLNESQLTSKAKAWLKALTDALNKSRKLTDATQQSQLFTKENCENAIKGLFGIAKERPRLRTPVINSLKQWVDDNHENQGPKHKLIYEHNQNMLKEGFKWFLFRDDCRQHHRACLQVIKILTNKDPSEYREIQKQINIRRKQAASNDKKHIATQKERTKQREVQLLLELDDEYLVSLAVNCCKKFEIEKEERSRINSLSSPIGDALKSLVKSLDDAKSGENEKQRRDRQYRKQQKKQLVALQLKSLSENEKREIISKCWNRLLSDTTSTKIRMNGKRHIQAQLIAKLYSCNFIHVQDRDKLVDQITNDFHKLYPIGIQWLYHLAVKKDRSMYQDVLRIFLKNLKTKLSATDKIFTQFIINLPIISDDALKMVKKYAAGERITLGLSTMRDIILYRPKHAKLCLQNLLEYTTDGGGVGNDDSDLQYGAEVSGPAIRCVVNKLYPKPKFQLIIEQFAIEHFEELQRTPQYFDPRIPQPPSNELHSDPKMFKAQQALYKENKLKWQRSETQELKRFLSNHSKLFFALCTQKPQLLTKFIQIYVKCRQNVQIAINQQSESLIKYFGKETSPIINLIETCPKGGELFVQQAAKILTENGQEKPSISLYNALVKSYFTNNNGGGGQVRIFLPILKYLQHDMVNKLLPALLGQLEKDLCKEAIGMILKSTPKPAIEPSQLLVEIQCFAPTETSPHIEKIIALTNYCLGQGAYDKKALSAVLQQLVQKDPIPVLFMRTLIQTLLVYPDLTKFAMNILEILIFRNEIWKNKHLWDGFIRCCAMTQPESYAVLCKLGRPELKSVLIQKPELRAPLLEYALESTVRPYVLDVLKQDPALNKEDKKKIKIKQEKNVKKRSRDDMNGSGSGGDNDDSDFEPSVKKRIITDSSGVTTAVPSKTDQDVAAYRVQFFLNKFILESYKNDALFKMENFLRHNFANLLKIDPSHIIGVKCHRQIPANIRLPEDTVICEVIFLNTNLNNQNMKEITNTFKQHLQTMDFSSWKIFVGSQYVTIQELTHQQLLILIKQLGITLPLQGNLESIAQILKIASQQTGNDGDDKHHRSSRKHSRRDRDRDRDRSRDRDRKKRRHRRKHKHRSRKHKSKRSRRNKHNETDEEEEEEEEERDRKGRDRDDESVSNDENGTKQSESDNEQERNDDDDDSSMANDSDDNDSDDNQQIENDRQSIQSEDNENEDESEEEEESVDGTTNNMEVEREVDDDESGQDEESNDDEEEEESSEDEEDDDDDDDMDNELKPETRKRRIRRIRDRDTNDKNNKNDKSDRRESRERDRRHREKRERKDRHKSDRKRYR